MTKKLILEIPFPETMEVQAPVTWSIKYIGVYDDIYKIYLIEHIIKWFQNPKNEGQFIIDSGMRMIEIVLDGLINSFNKKYLDDHFMKRELTHFLFGHRYSSGLDLNEYKFKYDVDCNGVKLGVVGDKYQYADEADLVNTLVSNFTSTFNKPMFEYTIIDK